MTSIVKARALRDEDKLERRHDILDAAERLFRERPEGLASMDDLAEAAGVAKGTLYLYFPSKELVMLGLHERQMHRVFDALDRTLADKKRFTLDDLYVVTHKQILADPSHLPLATLVMGFVGRSIGVDDVIRIHLSVGERIMRSGAALERALGLPAGDGTLLLNYTYAFTIGLWQLTGCGRLVPESLKAADPKLRLFLKGDPVDMRRALNHLWNGMLNHGKRNATGKTDRGGAKKRRRP